MNYNFPYYDISDYKGNGGAFKWSSENELYSYYDVSGARPQTINNLFTSKISKFTISFGSTYLPSIGSLESRLQFINLEVSSLNII